MTPAEAALLARRSDVAIVFGDPRRGRGLRQPGPVAAVGPGRRDRGGRGGQPEHRRRARDRQPGRHAVARRRARDRRRPGTPARPAARRSPRCSPAPSTRPGRLPITLPGRPRADAAARAPGPRHAVGHGGDDPLRRGRRGRLPLVRPAGRDAALRVRPRPELHELRVRRPRGRAAARPSPRRSPSPTPASATAPTSPSST